MGFGNNYIGVMDKGLAKAIKWAGGVNALGRKLEITGQAVSKWNRIPAERVPEIERVTGIPRAELRSDLWGPES